MSKIRFLLSIAVLAVNVICDSNACAEELASAPMVTRDSLQSLAVSPTTANRIIPAGWSLRGGIGVYRTLEDPSDTVAAGMIDTIDLLVTNNLSLALDTEFWVSPGPSSVGAEPVTMPILLGVQASLFPSSVVRPYGTGCVGPCLSRWSVPTWAYLYGSPWFQTGSEEKLDLSLAYAIGGGVEVGSGRGIFFSIDYRYLVAGRDGNLGGHILSMCLGWRWLPNPSSG